ITATIDAQAVTSTPPTITVTPPPAPLHSTLTVSSASVATGSTMSVTLTARDTFGNQTGGGSALTFGLANGSAGSGTFKNVIDNQNGTYTASFTGTVTGSVTIIATIDGQPITSPMPTITVTKGQPTPGKWSS